MGSATRLTSGTPPCSCEWVAHTFEPKAWFACALSVTGAMCRLEQCQIDDEALQGFEERGQFIVPGALVL